MPEPLGVAFVEIEPVATGFRAKTEAQLRTALAGSTASARAATGAQEQLTVAENEGAASAERKAVAEGNAAGATRAHAIAARHAAADIGREAAAMTGLRGAALSGNAALAAGAVAAIALFKSAELADEFNEQMHQIEAATHATRSELEGARESAIGLGRDLNLPGTSALESVKAINLLVRSGFDLEEAMDAARGALVLEAAAGEGLETSVRQVDRVLDAFNLSAQESVRVADAIATGLRFTQGNATEFSQALSNLAPAADSLGLSLEATNTLVLQLAESGLSTTQAAGSLRQAFLKLAAGGKGVNDGLKEIGLSMADLRDEFGRLRPDAFVILADAMADLDRATRLQILTQIFSRRAALGVIRIIDQQRVGFDRMSEKAREQGVALEEARAKTSSFGGQLHELNNDLSDAGTQFGRLAQGPMTALVGAVRLNVILLGDFAHALNLAVGFVGDLGREAANAVAPLGDLYDVLKKVVDLQRNPLGGLTDFLGDIPDKIADAATGLQQAINLNVKGIADIPGIQELADNLGLLVGAWEKGRAGVKRAADGMADDVDTAMTRQETRIAAGIPRVATLTGQLAVAFATGSESDQLSILQQRRAKQEADLARKQKRFQAGKVNEQAVTNAANALAATNAQIASIMAGMQADADAAASDAKERADAIVKAADERDQAFIRAIQAGQADREGRVTAAAATPDFSDDIRADVKLRNFLTNMIAATRARIRQARAAGRDTRALAAELADLRRARNQVRREIEQLRRDARVQAAETRIESTELDVEFAAIGQDTENRTQASINKEVRARQALIRALKKAQALTARGTVEWKRYRNRIAEEQAAIADLKKQRGKGQAELIALQKQEFAFLQTMHGFTFNLIGNLIPGMSTAGLVGGSAGGGTPGRVGGAGTSSTSTGPGMAPFPGAILPEEHGRGQRPPSAAMPRTASTAGAPTRPVTTAQGNTQIMLLRQIRAEIRKLNRGAEHPEAHRQRATGTAALDNSYQGTHGM